MKRTGDDIERLRAELKHDAEQIELLDRMKLDIEDVRPAFIDNETYIILDDLRAFRHLFRNLYARPIDSDKILLIQKKVPRAVSGFKEAIRKYLFFLKDLKETMDP